MDAEGRKLPKLHDQLERAFERWSRIAARRRRSVFGLTGLVALALMLPIPTLRVDNSVESFLHPEDPIRVGYDAFREQFGRDERILILIESDDVLEPVFAERLASLHRALEERVPYVDRIRSLANARVTTVEGDTLHVGELLDPWPTDDVDWQRVRAQVAANPLYQGTLVSRDRRVAVVAIELLAFDPGVEETEPSDFDDATSGAELKLLSEVQSGAAAAVAREVALSYEASDFRVGLTGGIVIAERLNVMMQADLVRFLSLALLTIAGLLFLLFRRLSAVALPLLIVILSVLSTLGVMALMGTPVSIATMILPTFLLTVGVCDAIHVLALFDQAISRGAEREDAIASAFAHAGLPILLTSLTTAGGLASFATAELAPVANLGRFAPIGVLFALAYTLLLLPAVLAALPAPRRQAATRVAPASPLPGIAVRLGMRGLRHPWRTIAFGGAVLGVALACLPLVRFAHDPMEWFGESSPLVRTTQLANRHLGGAATIEVMVDSGVDLGLLEPTLLRSFESIAERLDELPRDDLRVARTTSLVDIVKEINQALHGGEQDARRLPEDRALIAQELLLFESAGSNDLVDVADSPFRIGRLTLQVPWVDAIAYPPLLERIETIVRSVLGNEVEVSVTGLIAMLGRCFDAVIRSMTRSYVIALLIICPLMVFLIGDLKLGFIAMIPNLAVVIITLGLMGASDIPIDGVTLMIGSIVIGVSVDDTIHFIHGIRRFAALGLSPSQATLRALETSGSALLFTSLVLASGFITFATAELRCMVHFGVLSSVAVLVAFAANVWLTPALVLVSGRASK